MARDDYRGSVEDMRLTDGRVWPMPITLGSRDTACSEGDDVALYAASGNLLGILHVEDTYSRDMKHEARETYGTDEEAHPGVAQIYVQGEQLLGGTLTGIETPDHTPLQELYKSPLALRNLFA